MTLPSLDARRARELVAQFHGRPILVVGDVMLDRFIVGRVTRISPEAPVPVVRFQSEHVRAGGAANVAQNIVALGGRVALVGMVGGDAAGKELTRLLAAAGVGVDGLIEDSAKPTQFRLIATLPSRKSSSVLKMSRPPVFTTGGMYFRKER